MTSQEIIEGLKGNWFFIVLFVVLLGGGVLMAVQPPSEEGDAADLRVPEVPAGAESVPLAGEKAFALKSREEQAHKDIKRYDADYKKDPNDEVQAPLALTRLGNVHYTELRDFGKAAQYYELLIGRFPEWKGTRAIYVNLAECYKNQNDTVNERGTYQRMMEVFEPHEQQHLYAKQKLGF